MSLDVMSCYGHVSNQRLQGQRGCLLSLQGITDMQVYRLGKVKVCTPQEKSVCQRFETIWERDVFEVQ